MIFSQRKSLRELGQPKPVKKEISHAAPSSARMIPAVVGLLYKLTEHL